MRLHVIIAAAIVAAASASAWAKLPSPPMTDELKAKAEEAKKKQAEAAKKDADLLSKYQDKAAENYKRNKGVKGGVPAAAKAKKK